MAKLIITRGLPASGKTTWARQVIDAAPAGSIVRLNRDDLRRMALTSNYRAPVYDIERWISATRDAALSAALGSGRDVVADDTNLRAKYVRDLMEIAARHEAEVMFQDFTDVPVDECVKRDSTRTGAERVGETVIRDMYSRYLVGLKGKPLPIPGIPVRSSPEPYEPRPGSPRAVIADIDGTVALMGTRNPYDESSVADDQPNQPVISIIRALMKQGLQVIFMSGRTENCRAETEAWLTRYINPSWLALLTGGSTPTIRLYMRSAGDSRPDHVIKLELFDKYVRDRFDVMAVLDDRNQVVDLWRSLGLTCLQVAPGDF